MLGAMLKIAQASYSYAHSLTTAATQLVEHLIEGHLTEADLIAAQQALESGNRDPDRAILASLKTSTAEDAPALFPDLDALYALLDETEAES